MAKDLCIFPSTAKACVFFLNQISGGSFTSNKADFGGFVYKEGKGNTSCDGASIDGHKGVDGGAIYAVDGATLDWKCNLKGNLAVSGPAM